MSAYIKKGIVKFFNALKNFGFIESENKEECFFSGSILKTNSIPCHGDEVFYFPSMGKRGLTAEAVYLNKDLYGEVILFPQKGKQNWDLLPEGYYCCEERNNIYNIFNLESQVNYILIPSYLSRVGTDKFFDICPKNWTNKKEIIIKEHGYVPYCIRQEYVEYNGQLVRADNFDVKYVDDFAKWQYKVAIAIENLKREISVFMTEYSSFCKFNPSNKEGIHLFLKEYGEEKSYSFNNDLIIIDDDEDPYGMGYIYTTEEEDEITKFIRKILYKINSFREEAKKLELSSENIPQLCGVIFNGIEYNIDPV